MDLHHHRLLLSIMIIAMLWLPAYGASENMAAKDALVILADLSGSMREDIQVKQPRKSADANQDLSDDAEKVTLSKAKIEKRLILQLADGLVEKGAPFGILAVEYVAGRKACYRELLPIGRYDQDTARDEIDKRLKTDYPLFNRRTPLGDVMRQVDENLLSHRTGKSVLLLISDGRESFYDSDSDYEASKAAALDPEDAVRGPLTETRRLKERYADKVRLFTVFVEKEDDSNKNRESEIRLTRMAQQGMGTVSDGLAWYREPERIQAFINGLIR